MLGFLLFYNKKSHWFTFVLFYDLLASSSTVMGSSPDLSILQFRP